MAFVDSAESLRVAAYNSLVAVTFVMFFSGAAATIRVSPSGHDSSLCRSNAAPCLTVAFAVHISLSQGVVAIEQGCLPRSHQLKPPRKPLSPVEQPHAVFSCSDYR